MQINESGLIEREICIRNLSMTEEVIETRRASIRWLALALGIINPGESRLGALAVFDSVLYFHFKEKSKPNVKQLSDYITEKWGKMNEKTLRYHLLQLKKIGIVKHSKGEYSMIEPTNGDKYDEGAWVDSYFEREIKPIQDKISSMLKGLRQR
jgi:hypothetical protein